MELCGKCGETVNASRACACDRERLRVERERTQRFIHVDYSLVEQRFVAHNGTPVSSRWQNKTPQEILDDVNSLLHELGWTKV